MFSARVKAESDYGVNQSQKRKERYVGEPLAQFWLFASVSETDTTPTEEIKYKKELSGGTPCKIPVVTFSCSALVRLPREANSGLKKYIARLGDPLKNYGCLIQLV